MKLQGELHPFSINSDKSSIHCRVPGLKQALDGCREVPQNGDSTPRAGWSALRCFLHGLCVIVLTVFLLDLMAAGFLTFPLSAAHLRDLLVIGVCALLLAVLHLTAPNQKSM